MMPMGIPTSFTFRIISISFQGVAAYARFFPSPIRTFCTTARSDHTSWCTLIKGAGLVAPLRSHGGLTEQTVPFIMNKTVDPDQRGQKPLRNYDAFYMVLNS